MHRPNSQRYESKVLVSHGMPHPRPYFDPSLHLRALRAPRGLIYQNPSPVEVGNTVEYEFGLLLAVAQFPNRAGSPKKDPASDASDGAADIPVRPHLSLRTSFEPFPLDTGNLESNNSPAEADVVPTNPETCRGGVILAGFMRKAPIDGELSLANIGEMRKLGQRLKELLL